MPMEQSFGSLPSMIVQSRPCFSQKTIERKEAHMPQWLNYKELKAEIAFTDVFEHYEIEVKIKGDQATCSCPLPSHDGDSTSPSFSANLDRNIFQCFGCGAKGNILDFICLMDGMNPKDAKQFHQVAVMAKRKFLYKPQREAPASSKQKASSKAKVVVNPPLDFELQGLDQEHPHFAELGLKPETVKHFGLGYCKRGLMAGRIAIPLHDPDGQLIGYAGKLVDEAKVSDDNPLYLLPARRERKNVIYDFRPGLFLYHGHTITKPVNNLIIAQGFMSVWRLWQKGKRDVVSSVEVGLTNQQACLLVRLTDAKQGCVWLVANSYDRLNIEVLQKVGGNRYCKWIDAKL